MINGDTMAKATNKFFIENSSRDLDPYLEGKNKVLETIKYISSKSISEMKDDFDRIKYNPSIAYTKGKDNKNISKNPYITNLLSLAVGEPDTGPYSPKGLNKPETLNKNVSDWLQNLATILITPKDPKREKTTIGNNPYTNKKSSLTARLENQRTLTEVAKDFVQKQIKDKLSDENIANTIKELVPGRPEAKVQKYLNEHGQLPAYMELYRNQLSPTGTVGELDALDNPSLPLGSRTYDPVTDTNSVFSKDELTTLGSLLKNRDTKITGEDGRQIGVINTADPNIASDQDIKYKKDYITADDMNPGNISRDAAIGKAIGKASYGTYDPVTGEWQPGVPDVEGNYIVKDTHNWNRDYTHGLSHFPSLYNLAMGVSPAKLDLPPGYLEALPESIAQTFGARDDLGEGQKIEITVPTYQNDPMGHMDLIDRRGLENSGGMPGMYWQDEAFSTDDTSSGTEDQGYTSLDIGYRRGGQISQGLDNLYMNKRDSKQKLNNMMGFQERQYGGGLDDTYLNMSRRRSNAFADPNANTAFDSPMSIGGLPTVYRDNGGLTDPGGDNFMSSNLSDPSDPNDDWNDPANWAKTGLLNTPAPPAPPAPTTGGAGPDIPDWAWSVDDKGISSIVGPEGQVDPKYEHAGSGIEGRQELLARWRGKKEADGMTRMEYTYLNDIRDKTGMTMPKAEEYLASVMATPGGVAAMEQGFHGSYTGGGPFGTIGNFIGGIGDDLGMAGIYERERKRQQADKDFKAGFTGEDPSILTNIQDTVSRYFKGREGITTIEGQEEFKAALERQGHTFTPKTQSDIDKYIGYGLSMVNPLSSVASIAEFITGATPLGTITSKEGLSFTLDANGKVIPEQFFKQDIDYGPDPSPKKPVPKKKKKKILPEEEEEEKSTPKNNINSPRMKASNIESLKTYMSLTGKDLSDSKQDLAITDISITEEDFT